MKQFWDNQCESLMLIWSVNKIAKDNNKGLQIEMWIVWQMLVLKVTTINCALDMIIKAHGWNIICQSFNIIFHKFQLTYMLNDLFVDCIIIFHCETCFI